MPACRQGSRLKACPPDGRRGSVGLDLSLFAYIPRIRRHIGRHKPNTRKLIKPIFAFSRNSLYRRCHTVFAAPEPDRHPSGRAEPFSTVNSYDIYCVKFTYYIYQHLTPTLRFGVTHERNFKPSMKMSFFVLCP